MYKMTEFSSYELFQWGDAPIDENTLPELISFFKAKRK